jgi:hypothetical protein
VFTGCRSHGCWCEQHADDTFSSCPPPQLTGIVGISTAGYSTHNVPPEWADQYVYDASAAVARQAAGGNARSDGPPLSRFLPKSMPPAAFFGSLNQRVTEATGIPLAIAAGTAQQ